ncbi:MAG TPA: hypothetical protein VN366_06065 [Feifaniaceae bacterium]|nr:hypothetical protein [Feifaniaceae bacterium]
MNREEALYLGIDTSCYTTSVACVGHSGIVFSERTMLRVHLGEAGLRQSEGVFQHIGNLERMLPEALLRIDTGRIAAVAVSAAPRDLEGSYMPVFAVGRSAAASVAAALHAPLYKSSHQAGHIRAALYGNESLLKKDFLSLHISGGTTELVLIQMDGGRIGELKLMGGTSDLHAGQFVDRVGVNMGLPFPAGMELERLARQYSGTDTVLLPSSVKGLSCSFSGVETRARRLLAKGAEKEAVAFAVYDCLSRTVAKLLLLAYEKTKIPDVLLCGGVAGSALLRELLKERLKKSALALYFGQPALSGDNAVGVALLAKDIDARNDS